MAADDAVGALRALWRAGVRVVRRDDGTLALVPPDRVTPELIAQAAAVKPAIAALVATLPSSGRCRICGEPTGAYPPRALGTCVACALLAAERLGYA